MIEDRAGSDEFRATHEFMAQMLGTRRATVTEAAHDLQQRGLIAYRRGQVKVLNRQALEKAACSCYRIIREQFDELP
jgi:CRP-like cAMP-binding protein